MVMCIGEATPPPPPPIFPKQGAATYIAIRKYNTTHRKVRGGGGGDTLSYAPGHVNDFAFTWQLVSVRSIHFNSYVAYVCSL
ncbi:hypothetical protein HanRHA438_Chr08g0361771 [Helianthus annuus]|nr:hypothetical protein HanRHA438_Chr08g0361771 [Helianthus annuus]